MFLLAVPLFLKVAAVSSAICVGGLFWMKKRGITTQDVTEEVFDFVSYALIDTDPRPRWLIKKRIEECDYCDEDYTCWRCM